ncbi:hypothetical protein [Sphingomonas sp. Leaf357]|uniref:hypothetical protein n=1 Tax=Sphingomonas sp. Leaf357 TaxID=1736350 RepID=UPI0012E13E6F|nr:hypothetical protein [Sphingomonas sp. Leaf357]
MIDDERQEDVEVPQEFWGAEGHEALDQDWVSGDFSTWIDHSAHWQAFGVTFGLSGLLEMLPVERRGVVAHGLSVAGSPEWIPAKGARQFAYERGGITPGKAGTAVIEQARLGFLTARAVHAEAFKGDRYEVQNSWEQREWDIPLWFWEGFTSNGSSAQDWELGKFSGKGRSPDGLRFITLSSVNFLRESLNALVSFQAVVSEALSLGVRPPLADAVLKEWWEKRSKVRDLLSEADLVALVRSNYPENHVSRDRMRQLMGPRKTGPK